MFQLISYPKFYLQVNAEKDDKIYSTCLRKFSGRTIVMYKSQVDKSLNMQYTGYFSSSKITVKSMVLSAFPYRINTHFTKAAKHHQEELPSSNT